MRWEVMSVMPVITANIMSGMVSVIVAMAHPEDRADDHGRQPSSSRHGMRCSDAAPWRSRHPDDDQPDRSGQAFAPADWHRGSFPVND